MKTSNLFEAFPPVSAKEWKQKIQYDLKGLEYNEALLWESPEGIKVKPFYHTDDGAPDYTVNKNEGWNIGQHVYAGNSAEANKKAQKFIQQGAESLAFAIPSEATAPSQLFQGLTLESCPNYIELDFLSLDYVKSIADCLGDSVQNIHLNIDVLGRLAKTGNWFMDKESDHKVLNSILHLDIPHTLAVDTTIYQNAGANMVQQLAYGLAHANEYLNHLDSLGNKDQMITFKVAVGTNYFFEIAKIRALRILWEQLAKVYGMPIVCHIITVPTRRNKTLYDYNTNMLRTTTECMASVLGGSDTVCNVPYDAIYHKNNAFGDRIALNQLVLLKSESYLNRTDNAADGAYFIESLTEQLAQQALKLFKTIEIGGGFLKQLVNHTIQKKIGESAAKEQEAFNSGKEVLVGTNAYVNPNDKMNGELQLYPFVKKDKRKTFIAPIIGKRLAEEIEQKRLEDE